MLVADALAGEGSTVMANVVTGGDGRRCCWCTASPNLIHLNEVAKGNHFAAWQEPQRFTTEVQAAFRSLR
jgi:hypothetical protein